MSKTIDELSREDTFDSREVIERIEELESVPFNQLDEGEKQELVDLQDFAREGESVADWQYGEMFVADDYFEDYARELAKDVGAISGEEAWPLSHIDWEAAADALKQDYTGFELAGETFWARA